MPQSLPTLCGSIMGSPFSLSAKIHNAAYAALGLDYTFVCFGIEDPVAGVAAIRALGVRGMNVSMPYKTVVMEHLDAIDEAALVIGAVNTINNIDGVLTGYNTDYSAIALLIARNRLALRQAQGPGLSVLLRGSGGMAKATAAAFRDAGFTDVTIVARNEQSGRALAGLYGFDWAADVHDRTADIVVNVTPIGMVGAAEADALAFPPATIDAAAVVFDVVALPTETPLVRAGRIAGTTVITGSEVATLQALEQFVLYTGIRPSDEQVRAASEFMRAP